MTELTDRMRNWLEGTGAHIGTATCQGFPSVTVVRQARVENRSTVRFPLSPKQVNVISVNLAENPRVAFGPGGLGALRAAYQFKGRGRLEGTDLLVDVEEIYCTKPGPEAGLRLDVLSREALDKFERTRWRDNGPPC